MKRGNVDASAPGKVQKPHRQRIVYCWHRGEAYENKWKTTHLKQLSKKDNGKEEKNLLSNYNGFANKKLHGHSLPMQTSSFSLPNARK